MAHLSKELPQDSRIFIDTGNIWAWATHYLSRSENNGLYRVSMGYGSMAWAIGAVIGSAMASPKEPHTCISGDGAWLMSSHEIGVAVQNQLPILFIVLNDSAFGMIRFGQELSQAESIGWKLNEVDFALLAKAQGANGIIINSPNELVEVDFKAIFNDNKPTLLDVRIDKDEMPPMMARVKSLNEGKQEAKGYS
jgi:acetolactate synthase-1/2/3 large subunit